MATETPVQKKRKLWDKLCTQLDLFRKLADDPDIHPHHVDREACQTVGLALEYRKAKLATADDPTKKRKRVAIEDMFVTTAEFDWKNARDSTTEAQLVSAGEAVNGTTTAYLAAHMNGQSPAMRARLAKNAMDFLGLTEDAIRAVAARPSNGGAAFLVPYKATPDGTMCSIEALCAEMNGKKGVSISSCFQLDPETNDSNVGVRISACDRPIEDE